LRGHETQQETKRQYQIVLVEVQGLIQQDNVAEAQGQTHDRQAIKQAQRYHKCKYRKKTKMQVKPVAWPWGHPFESGVLERHYAVREIGAYPIVQEKTDCLRKYEETE
jgi:hypothetical protein